jgi:protein-tyrosine phosphatase
MVDRAELHFHLLPGVDDGPQTMDEALELARLAVADGTATVVATPHANRVDLDELPGRVAEVQARLREAGIPLEVRCGAELAWADVARASGGQLASVAHGPPGERWVLLEAPLPGGGAGPAGAREDFSAAAADLRARGFAVLVGHPERVPSLLSDGAAPLHAELAAGSLLQLNATSIVGAHGEAIRRSALQLARDGLAAVVASDAHRPSRGPALSAALRALLHADVAPERARDMVDAAPRAVLERGLDVRRAVARGAST